MGRRSLLLLGLLVLLQAAPAMAGWSLLKKLLGGGGGSGGSCKAVAPQPGVDLKKYTSTRWYIHSQVSFLRPART